MRRPTLIAIILLLVLLTVATITQIVIASRDSPVLPGPTRPGQLPTTSSGTAAP